MDCPLWLSNEAERVGIHLFKISFDEISSATHVYMCVCAVCRTIYFHVYEERRVRTCQ
jgi:hypothetical protein